MPPDNFQRESKVSCLPLSKNLTHQQTTCSRILKTAAVCFSASWQLWWPCVRAILSHKLVNYIYNNFERVEMKLSKEEKPWRNVDNRHQFICWEFSVWPWCDFLFKLYKNLSIICKCVWIWASSCRRKAIGESEDLQLYLLLQPSHWFLKCFSPAEKVKTKLIVNCEFHLSESTWPWPWGMGMASKSSTCSADESAAAAVRQRIRLKIGCKRIKTKKRAKGDNAQDTAA